jgi:SAM-dependent methyltransferase
VADSSEFERWLMPEQEGVYLLDPRYQGERPRKASVGGTTLYRFLDVIYVPVPMEHLSVPQIQVVNALRLRLVAGGYMSPVHTAVKEVFSGIIDRRSPGLVVEWGCGFDPLDLRLRTTADYVGVDIDRAVVDFQRRLGVRCFEPDDPALGALLGGRVDLIARVFVCHFPIAEAHLGTMRSLLAPGGGIIANVYKRARESRGALAEEFRRRGFGIGRVDDDARLCADHEYWWLRAGASDTETAGELEALLAPEASQRED